MVKLKKRVAFVDCGEAPSHGQRVLEHYLPETDFEITQDHDAEYVIHSCMGRRVLQYSGVRIFMCGECVSPDFNISDYALAFDRLDFQDRNLWLPLIKIYRDAYEHLLKKPVAPDTIVGENRDFCCYVMSNTKNSASERIEIFDRLNAYKNVRSGGRWRNNTGGPIKDKLAFQRRHKFAIAFENNSHPGYITEKFAEAAQAGAIPIYWGDPDIGRYFNSKAFINCHAYPSLEAAVDAVIEVDRNPSRYRAMLEEPWFLGGNEPDRLKDETVHAFLKNIFEQPHATAYRRNRSRWGLKYERSLYRATYRPILQFWHQFRNRIRKKDTL